jgi:hypothetical protein
MTANACGPDRFFNFFGRSGFEGIMPIQNGDMIRAGIKGHDISSDNVHGVSVS